MFFLLILLIPTLVAIGLFVYFIFNQELDAKSWHARLFKFVWGVNPQDKFSWMCPYAWAQFGTISFIVPILTAKYLSASIGIFFYGMNDYLEEQRDSAEARRNSYIESRAVVWKQEFLEQWENYKVNKTLTKNSVLASIFRYINGGYYTKQDRIIFYAVEHRQILLNYEERRLLESSAYQHAELEAKELEYKTNAPSILTKMPSIKLVTISPDTKKNLVKKLVKVGKFLGKIVMVSAVVSFAYLLYAFVMWLSTFSLGVSFMTFVNVVKWATFMTTIIFIVASVVMNFYEYNRSLDNCYPCAKRSDDLSLFLQKFFYYSSLPFMFLGKQVYLLSILLSGIWKGLVAYKNDNCPAITWKK